MPEIWIYYILGMGYKVQMKSSEADRFISG